jgi:hypothetical protein
MAATWRVRYSCPEPGDSLCIPIATSCSSHLPEARHTGPRGHPAGYGDPQTWGTGPWSHRRWSWTPRVCARSRRRYRPGRPVRSAEHAHVVPDVPPTPRRAVRGAYGWRETPCQRHVSPHNPSRFETTTDIPPPAAISPHSCRPQSDVPTVVPRRRRRAVRPGCWCGWCRRSRGHEADPSFDDAIAAATVGSGGNHPDLAARRLQVPGRLRLMLGPLSTPAPTPMSRTFSPVIRGVTQTRRSATHPVHLWRHISL